MTPLFVSCNFGRGHHSKFESDAAEWLESPDEIIIAALLHDFGQFLPLERTRDLEMSVEGLSVGRVGHEKLGEEYLRSLGFSEVVCRLVGSHVAAKRFRFSFLFLHFPTIPLSFSNSPLVKTETSF
jgi:predicted HD phosphohydrolase